MKRSSPMLGAIDALKDTGAHRISNLHTRRPADGLAERVAVSFAVAVAIGVVSLGAAGAAIHDLSSKRNLLEPTSVVLRPVHWSGTTPTSEVEVEIETELELELETEMPTEVPSARSPRVTDSSKTVEKQGPAQKPNAQPSSGFEYPSKRPLCSTVAAKRSHADGKLAKCDVHDDLRELKQPLGALLLTSGLAAHGQELPFIIHIDPSTGRVKSAALNHAKLELPVSGRALQQLEARMVELIRRFEFVQLEGVRPSSQRFEFTFRL